MLFRYKPDIFTDIPGIKHYVPQAVPVVLKLCRMAGIAGAVDRMARWNESNAKISPGLVIESLVTCIMCDRKPLWRVQEFWARQDLALLFPGMELSSGQLNDDACGRALDKLAEIDMKNLISACCLTMLQEHDLGILTGHFDTTSISVQGAYDNDTYGDFDICYGNSKDKRPDLKQFMIGAGVQQDGLPVMGQILAGATSDKRRRPEAALEKRKAKTLQKRIARQQESLSKEARELLAQSFACVPDAERALGDLKDKAERLGFAAEGTVETVVDLSYPHKGRPRKGEEPIARTTYRSDLKIGEIAPAYYERLCQMESTFVLISSIKEEMNYDDRKILTEYKRQSNIEQRFRFLKSPVYLGPVYLYTKRRIEALGYVFILVLLIAYILKSIRHSPQIYVIT